MLNKNVCRIWSSLVGEKYVLVWQKGTEDEEEITDSFQLNILLDRLLAGEDTLLIKLHVLSPSKEINYFYYNIETKFELFLVL